MSTVLPGPPTAPEKQPQAGEQTPTAEATIPEGEAPPGSGEPRSCAKCGSPLAPGQDWCLQCGAAAGGALGPPMWRSTGAVFAVLGVLALGAAAAAVAALNQHSPPPKTVTSIVAQTPPPATPPATTTPTTPPPATPPAAGKQALPQAPAKLPKIPLTASTPTTTTPPAPQTTPSESNAESPSSPGTSGGETGSSEGGSSTPTAILLDTDAASTYNPYSYPASYFGDPSRTIDGDHGTTWTAQVAPATAPAMAEGLLIDLKGRKRLAALELVSPSKGMLVQVYGSTAAKAPASITEKAWVPLTAPLVLKKANTHFKLRQSQKAFRFVTVWISRAPASAVGTPTAPGQVSIGEVELFQAS